LIDADEERKGEVTQRFPVVTALLEKVREYEQQETKLGKLLADLSRLPPDPDEFRTRARNVHDALDVAARALSPSQRLRPRREELAQGLQDEEAASRDKKESEARGKKRADEVERLRPEAEKATTARGQADDTATEARTLMQQARRQLEEVTHLEGA